MKRQQKGMRGGFVAGGELGARGLIVFPTSGSDVDLLVTDAAGSERVEICNERGRWLHNQPLALGAPTSRAVECTAQWESDWLRRLGIFKAKK